MPTRQVLLHPEETGGYSVTVPSLPGCFSEGETIEEALVMIKEAIELHIECMIEDGEEVPSAHPFIVKTVEIDEAEHAQTA